MAVDAVVAGVQLATGEPFPERRPAGVQRRVPVAVPVQHVRVFPEALGKILLREPFQYRGVCQIRLSDEPGGWTDVLLLAPVDRNLRFARLTSVLNRHGSRHPFRCMLPSATWHVAYDRPGGPRALSLRSGSIRIPRVTDIGCGFVSRLRQQCARSSSSRRETWTALCGPLASWPHSARRLSDSRKAPVL